MSIFVLKNKGVSPIFHRINIAKEKNIKNLNLEQYIWIKNIFVKENTKKHTKKTIWNCNKICITLK